MQFQFVSIHLGFHNCGISNIDQYISRNNSETAKTNIKIRINERLVLSRKVAILGEGEGLKEFLSQRTL